MNDLFVGREPELTVLRRAADEGRAGHRQVVMLAGGAGIGKTRAAQELEAYAREQGAMVLWGRARESAGAPPYWPWIQASRALWDGYDEETLRELLGPEIVESQRIFPELRNLFPGLPPLPEVVDGVAMQFRLFEAVTALYRRASVQQPIVLVLEDLHWADRATLLLLTHVVAELGDARTLVVGTYRDSELSSDHALTSVLAELNRGSGFESLALRGFSEDEVGRCVRATSGMEPSPAAASNIHRLTEGNPFFVQQVASLMTPEVVAGEQSLDEIALPGGVRAALRPRLSRLSVEAGELVTLAAVAGLDFSYGLLASLDLGEDEALVPLLEEAIEAGIIEELSAAGQYSFSHALMRETVLAELSTTRRARLHGRIADALDQRLGARAEEHASRLAAHFVESAAIDGAHAERAVHFSRLAGRQAEREMAWDDAAAHYRRALALIRGGGVEASMLEPELLTAIGRCSRNVADNEGAWEALSEAAQLCRERGDGAGFARATLETLEIHAGAERLIPLEDEALTLLDGADAHLEARLSIQRARWGWDDREQRAAERATELAGAHEFPDVDAFLLDRESHEAWEQQRFDDGQRAARAAHQAFDRVGYQALAAHHLHDAAMGWVFAGDLGRAEAAGIEVIDYARSCGNRFYEQSGELPVSVAAFVRCDAARLEALLGEFDDIAGDFFVPRLLRAAGFETSGAFDRATEELPLVNEDSVPPEFETGVLGARARIALHRGDELGARAELAAWAERFRDGALGGFYRWIALGEIDDCLAALGDDELVAAVQAEIVEWAAIRCAGIAGRSVDRIRGTLALRLGELDEAERWFERGRSWAERERGPVELGRCMQGLAEVSALRGEARAAIQRLEAAVAEFEAVGATLYLGQARGRLEALYAAPGGRQRGPDGLTARELEVLRLLAEGNSSRAIAEELVLSIRTVEWHIANIYAKTDTHSRAQATAYALKQGLA